jgi:hypothetical protein
MEGRVEQAVDFSGSRSNICRFSTGASVDRSTTGKVECHGRERRFTWFNQRRIPMHAGDFPGPPGGLNPGRTMVCRQSASTQRPVPRESVSPRRQRPVVLAKGGVDSPEAEMPRLAKLASMFLSTRFSGAPGSQDRGSGTALVPDT